MPCAGICRRGANSTIIGPTLLSSRISSHGRDMCGCISCGSVLLAGVTNMHSCLAVRLNNTCAWLKIHLERSVQTLICASTDYGHQMKAWIKEIRMFGVNLANKYSSTITKNLSLGYNSRLCPAGPLPFPYHASILCVYIHDSLRKSGETSSKCQKKIRFPKDFDPIV